MKRAIQDSDRIGNACCDWATFKEGYWWYHAKLFGYPPDINAWRAAKREWKSGNTGHEAANIAWVKEISRRMAA